MRASTARAVKDDDESCGTIFFPGGDAAAFACLAPAAVFFSPRQSLEGDNTGRRASRILSSLSKPGRRPLSLRPSAPGRRGGGPAAGFPDSSARGRFVAGYAMVGETAWH